MLKLKDFFGVLDKKAPLELSYKLIEKGDYDNSGIIVNDHLEVNKVLFSLDLSTKAVKRAKGLKCDTIVTHHPAIYNPIKCLSQEDLGTQALQLAVKSGMNVISMHLNLDVAENGIDASLCQALGGEKYKIIDFLTEKNGYGREFDLGGITLNELVKRIKLNLKTTKIVVYGKRNTRLNKGASFCGGGSGYAEKFVKNGLCKADVIVTSDMPHHVILSLVEAGKSVILIPHYASENYGFFRFYLSVSKELNSKVESYYFEDKRFL
ncbi:MAG: Nif3-like dinuclear metal center hexameric protein [Clostridia bacterium]|nr:Nif3-like dinuclear metal center hexameric protein [Clostridia bacterium]